MGKKNWIEFDNQEKKIWRGSEGRYC